MPLVNATDDAGFVVEVGDEVRTSCTRMNERACAMIEEYLRRRVEKVRGEVQRECNLQIEQMKQQMETVEADKAEKEKQHASAKEKLAEAVEIVRQRDARMRLLGCFLNWKRDVERRRAGRRLAEEFNRRRERLAMFQEYTQWRLFAAARRSTHVEAANLQKKDTRERELLGQIEAYQKSLREEQEKNESLSEKLKDAFVRGMCALNREAVQVLHGADNVRDDDVEAIAEILSRDSRSRKLLVSQNIAEDTMQHGSLQNQFICPVHHVDCDGNFYHRCYAPGYCPYGEDCPRPRSPSSSSVSPGPPFPFVVRADPRASRSFNATSSVSLRHVVKPPQARWKL